MQIYFNPLDKACKSVIGAVSQGKRIQFNIFCLNEPKSHDNERQTPTAEECFTPTQNAILSLNKDGGEAKDYAMQKTAFGWSITLTISETGLYFYRFKVDGIGYISCNDLHFGYISDTPRDFLLTVCSQDYQTPDWFKGGVMYQIFPDRFAKKGTMPDIKGRIRRDDWGGLPSYRPNELGKVLNNDFFGGNFKGIEEKADYLADLGVTTLYLNPIFLASSNHRYDTSDYMQIDPFLGNETDFSNLVETLENKGIKVILDGVFNHTGDDSVYFNRYGNFPTVGAYQSKDSPYYSWYSFYDFPNGYESWWGIDILPEVNEKSLDYQEFIFGNDGVLKKWLTFGIGGYRLDVADELPDFFLKKLRKSVKESNKNAIIIGEVWEDASNKIAYSERREYLQGYELDSVMNYPLKEAIISYMQSGNARVLLQAIRTLIDHYPKQTLDCLMNILGTHDTSRILTVLGGIYCRNKDEMASKNAFLSPKNKENALKKLKMAAVLQYTLPGVPCLYYGDENGAEGHIDPFCRTCFDWDNLNEDLIAFYQKLGKIRKEYKEIFKDGDFEEIVCQDGLIIYKRIKDNKSIFVYSNNSSKRYPLKIKKAKELISGESFEELLEIKPQSYGIFVEKKA